MPELPEIETIKRILEPQLKNRRIEKVQINNEQVIAYPDPNTFRKELTHQVIKGMRRRGKYLIINFVNNDRLIVHLRMTGQLLVTPTDFKVEKHTHLIADLSSEKQIRYIDVRRFGRFWYLRKDEADAIAGLDKLGIEPLSKNLNGQYLMKKAGKSRRYVKTMLHDQKIVAGIGNIYSDEILFKARLNPQQRCNELELKDWDNLAQAIQFIIKWGIDTNKMTASEYLKTEGKDYRNIPNLKVYGREGEKCFHCGQIIKRVVINGRSSCYCPSCQSLK